MDKRFMSLLALSLLLAVPFVAADIEEDEGPSSFDLTYPYPMGEDDIYFQKGNSIKQLSNGNFLIAGMGSPEESNSTTGLLLEVEENGDEVWFSTVLKGDDRYTSELHSADEYGTGKWFFGVGESTNLPFDLAETGIYPNENEEEEEDGAKPYTEDDHYTSTIFSKFGSSGDSRWTKVAGDKNGSGIFVGRSVTLNSNGDAVFVASTEPIYNSFFGKVTSNGDLKWGAAIPDQLQQIIPLQDGYLLVGVGRYGSKECVSDIWSRCGARLIYIKISEHGEEVWGRVWGIDDKEFLSEAESRLLAGEENSTTTVDEEAKSNDGELALDTSDSAQSEDQQTKEEKEEVADDDEPAAEIYQVRATLTKDGGFMFVGSSNYKNSLLLLKTDSKGNAQWSKFYSQGEGDTEALGVAQLADGGFVVTGITDGDLNTDNEFEFVRSSSKLLLVKFDKDGEVVWSKTWSDLNLPINEGRSVVEASNGYIWVTGFSAAGIHYLEGKARHANAFDKDYLFTNPQLVVLKISPNGDIDELESNLDDVELIFHDKTFPSMVTDPRFAESKTELSEKYPLTEESDGFLGEDFTVFNILLMGGVVVAFLILIIWGVCLRMGKKNEEKEHLNAGMELSDQAGKV